MSDLPPTEGTQANTPLDELTDKQRLFIDEYFLCGLNASMAARKAGYKARQSGAENMSNPVIRQAIDERLKTVSMGADEVLARLAQQGRGDLREFATISTARGLANHPNGNIVKKFKRTVDTTSDLEGHTLHTEEKIELELYSAQDALIQMGRHHKLFTDNTDLTTGGDKLTAPMVFLPAIEPDEP